MMALKTPFLLTLLFSTSVFAETWLEKNCKQEQSYYFCKDLEYKESLKLDVYIPLMTESKSTKAILLFHGGCFYMGDKTDAQPDAIEFVKNNYVAIAVNYTSAKDKPYPAAYEDARDAALWVKRKLIPQLQMRKDWLGAFGASAGATLAGYLGTRPEPGQKSPTVNAVVDYFGRVNFFLPGAEGADDCPSIFAGDQNPITKEKRPNVDRKTYSKMNVAPVEGVKPAAFFIAHSEKDPTVDSVHSKILHKLLVQAGVRPAHRVLRIAQGDLHGFTIKEWPAIWSDTLQFLKTH